MINLIDYLLTIAIPTYNRSSLLQRTINSIVCQYDSRVELLVSDNASSDDTEEVMNKYLKEYDYIKYIRNQENIGPDNNFLQCYQKASGKYVLLLGSDDLVHHNSIKIILDFLEKNNPSWVFLNFNTFKNDNYIDGNFSKNYLKINGDLTSISKKAFIKYAKDKITFMSVSIIRKELILSVNNPERFKDSSFIHTCLMLESTKDCEANFGIISTPCIAEDVSPQNQGTGSNAFLVFGTKMRHVFCEIAPQCNYDKKQMSKIYRDYACYTWPRSIASRKANGKWLKDNFKKHGFPSVKMYIKTWFTIVPCLLIPSFIYKVIYKALRK